MTLKQAIRIVENHNKWRRSHRMDRNSPKMGDVYELGKALDVLLIVAKDYCKIYDMDRVQIKPKKNRIKMTDLNTQKVTRVEVIDDTGRAYVNWNPDNVVEVRLQDEGRTLKVFICKKNQEK